MKATRVDPRDQSWQDDHPIFRVYFWQKVSDNAYAFDEFEVRDANVIDVLGWAEQERRDRTFTLYLRRDDASGIGLVLLAGSDPTAQPSARDVPLVLGSHDDMSGPNGRQICKGPVPPCRVSVVAFGPACNARIRGVPCDNIPNDPLSDDHGFSRGTPLDRHYIEQFLQEHSDAIRGSVLEVGDPRYCDQFGAARIAARTIVDIDTSNPDATLIADLSTPDALPDNAFDCLILTETLHLLVAPDVCLQNCWHALRPGGSVLTTVPALKRLSPRTPESDYWRFTPAGLNLLLSRHWPGPFSVRAQGNLRVCVAFLLAHVVEDFEDEDLGPNDPRFPLTVAAVAHKPEGRTSLP